MDGQFSSTFMLNIPLITSSRVLVALKFHDEVDGKVCGDVDFVHDGFRDNRTISVEG